MNKIRILFWILFSCNTLPYKILWCIGQITAMQHLEGKTLKSLFIWLILPSHIKTWNYAGFDKTMFSSAIRCKRILKFPPDQQETIMNAKDTMHLFTVGQAFVWPSHFLVCIRASQGGKLCEWWTHPQSVVTKAMCVAFIIQHLMINSISNFEAFGQCKLTSVSRKPTSPGRSLRIVWIGNA